MSQYNYAIWNRKSQMIIKLVCLDIFIYIHFCNAFHTLALILEKQAPKLGHFDQLPIRFIYANDAGQLAASKCWDAQNECDPVAEYVVKYGVFCRYTLVLSKLWLEYSHTRRMMCWYEVPSIKQTIIWVT